MALSVEVVVALSAMLLPFPVTLVDKGLHDTPDTTAPGAIKLEVEPVNAKPKIFALLPPT